jgi:hypothetical protein
MKRIFLALFAVLPLSVLAQNPLSYFSIGPVVGIGGSWISQWPGDNENSTFLSGGLDLTYSRAENFGFGADLMVTREGFDARYDISGLERNLEVTPVYLRFQPKAIYFFNQWGDVVRPKIWLGPSFGLLLDETSDLNPDRALATEEDDQELGRRVFSRTDAGINMGAGFNVRVARGTWFTVGAAYYHGLVDVVDNNFMARDGYNRHLNAQIGMNFGLGITKQKAHHRGDR